MTQGSDGSDGRGSADDPQITAPSLGFWQLVVSDYRAHQVDEPDATLRLGPRYFIRLLYNPSLQLAFLVRLAQRGPRIVQFIVRWLQVSLFSSEIYWFTAGEDSIRLGPGINFPHPIGILIGAGARVGSNVTVFNNVSMGTDQAGRPELVWRRACRIGDGATIYPYATVMGPFTVGEEAAVGMHVVLNDDVPAGGLRTMKRLRQRGEWDPRALSGETPQPPAAWVERQKKSDAAKATEGP